MTQEIRLGFEAKPDVADVAEGERLVIRLGSAGTGHLWKLTFDERRCRFVDHQIRVESDAFGAPREDTFVVEPLSAGESQLRFDLQAPWESQPAKTVEITMRVHGPD